MSSIETLRDCWEQVKDIEVLRVLFLVVLATALANALYQDPEIGGQCHGA